MLFIICAGVAQLSSAPSGPANAPTNDILTNRKERRLPLQRAASNNTSVPLPIADIRMRKYLRLCCDYRKCDEAVDRLQSFLINQLRVITVEDLWRKRGDLQAFLPFLFNEGCFQLFRDGFLDEIVHPPGTNTSIVSWF